VSRPVETISVPVGSAKDPAPALQRQASEPGPRAVHTRVPVEVSVGKTSPAGALARRVLTAAPITAVTQPGSSQRCTSPQLGQRSKGTWKSEQEEQRVWCATKPNSAPLPVERNVAKPPQVKPGMCLAEWSASSQLTPRPGPQARLSPTRSRRIMRPRSALRSIQEAAEAFAGLEVAAPAVAHAPAGPEETPAVRTPISALAASGTAGEGATTAIEAAVQENATPAPMEPMVLNRQADRPRLQGGSGGVETPPRKALFSWAAALEQGIGAIDATSTADVHKPWKPGPMPEATFVEAARLEVPLLQRSGGCTLPLAGATAFSWVNQENHLVLPLSQHKVLVAVFDGHGRDPTMAARRARFTFEHQATACAGKLSPQPAEWLRTLFEIVHEELVGDEALAGPTGASVAAAIVDAAAQTATIAHVGDSKLMVANRWGVIEFETVQHFADPAAAAVAREAVSCHAEPRVELGGLAACCRAPPRGASSPGLWVTHTLNDWEEQAVGVRVVPFITSAVPLSHESALVAASGMVWEELRKEVVAHHAQSVGAGPEASALSVLRQARSQHLHRGDSETWQTLGATASSPAAVVVRGGSL